MLPNLKSLALIASVGIATIARQRKKCGQPHPGRSQNLSMLSSSQILNRMAATYSQCDTYVDTGTAFTVFKSADGTWIKVKPFATAMVRPDQFRFEYSEEGEPDSRLVVWRNGNEVRTWWALTKKAEQAESLGLALAGATGVSSGSAHTIPALLMPYEVGGRQLTDLQQVARGEDEALGAHKCFTIEGLYAGRGIKIWIDQDSYLVRRIDGTAEFNGFSTATTTLYRPVIGGDVTPNLLEYDAPD
jgi:hypothetical protein